MCVCVYVCVYLYVCIYVCMYVFLFVYVSMYLSVDVTYQQDNNKTETETKKNSMVSHTYIVVGRSVLIFVQVKEMMSH